MDIIPVIITLIVVGVLLWAANTLLAPYMQAEILRILNIVVVLFVIVWLVYLFIGFVPHAYLPLPHK
jgi:hypothetical protein